MACDVLKCGLSMDGIRTVRRLFALTRPWVAGLLALVWLGLAAESVNHQCAPASPAHHDCAACQMAHGTLLANGSVTISLVVMVDTVDCLPVKKLSPLACSDLRLAPGRAPPA